MSLEDLIGSDLDDGFDGEDKERSGIWRRITHAFRERQIYVRSDGNVQFIILRSWVQVFAAIIVTAGLFWLAYASVNIAFKDQLIALKERRTQQSRIAYEDRLTSMRTAVDRLSGQLLLDQDQYLEKVDVLGSEFDKLAERHRRMEQFFRQGWVPTRKASVPQAPEPGRAEETPADGSFETPAASQYSAPGFTGKGDLGLRSIEDGKGSDFQKGSSIAPKTETFANHAQAEAPLVRLRTRFADIGARQLALLDEVEKASDDRIRTAKKAIKRIGLNPKRVVKVFKKEKTNIGGPYVDPNDPAFKDDILGNKMLLAGRKIAEAQLLSKALDKMPLDYPMRGRYRVTSGFGVRNDPFRRRRAMHTGIDFKSKFGHPVRVTADGVVKSAGRKGAYGKMIEVRHANGIRTRYAHLSMIKVRRGQKVKRGQMIGKLGNTGRSTGPHLHYETRIWKKAISPRRFWKAQKLLQ
jgi:murein DD-endopeptidase MepM/ murein hydrolase activator NlpD